MKFFIHTLGCAKNEFDSSALARLLVENGFKQVSSVEEADVVLLNTCGFIESAIEETVEVAESINSSLKHGQRFVVMGCAVNYLKEKVKDLIKADMYVETGALKELPGLLAGVPEAYVSGSGLLPCRTAQEGRPSVFIKVAEGCSNRCSYCAIPLIRGEKSIYPAEAVLAEAIRLARSGSREFNLIAQDLASYPGLVELVSGLSSRLADELDEFWIRLLYVNPENVTLDMLKSIFSFKGVVPYLEMPVQSGSHGILKKMNRRRHPDDILEMVEALRRQFHGLVVRTTFLVGFPGETDADFEQTIDFLHRLTPDYAAVFPYNRMPGTPAEKMSPQLPREVIMERARELQEEVDAIMLSNRLKRIGSTVRVLVESEGNPSRGRSYGQAPEIDGEVLIENPVVKGMYYDIELLDIHEYDYTGRVRSG